MAAAADARWNAIADAIAATGSYELTFDELEHGMRVAWRNAPKCSNRKHWRELRLVDRRYDCRTNRDVRDRRRHHGIAATPRPRPRRGSSATSIVRDEDRPQRSVAPRGGPPGRPPPRDARGRRLRGRRRSRTARRSSTRAWTTSRRRRGAASRTASSRCSRTACASGTTSSWASRARAAPTAGSRATRRASRSRRCSATASAGNPATARASTTCRSSSRRAARPSSFRCRRRPPRPCGSATRSTTGWRAST